MATRGGHRAANTDTMESRFSRAAGRFVAGALIGLCAWAPTSAALPFLPTPVRFLVGWLVFTFGPGVAVAGRLTRALDSLTRVVVVLGVGSAAAPVLVDVLGRLNLVPAFPYVAAALAGGGLMFWRESGMETPPQISRADAAACAGLVTLVIGLGAIVFWHRLQASSGGILLYGDYDTADMSYYAAEVSEMTHTVPPMASYYSGHKLNAAYYAHLVPGMIHRFAAVPVLEMFYRYAWPTFLSLTALTAFALVRSLASRGVAVLAVVLILTCSDFSYLAAWLLPHAGGSWDYVLWPTNFLSTTMEVQHFSTWGPSLPVFFTVLYAIVRGIQTRTSSWIFLSAFLIAVLFEFKPFAYVILMAGLCAATVFSKGDWPARRRFAATVGLGILLSLPFVFQAATIAPQDRRTRLVIDYFLLPKRMLLKLDVVEAFEHAASRLAPLASMQTAMFLLFATIVFLVGGMGIRWAGAPGVWRAIRRTDGPDAASWRLLAWVAVAGIAVPFVLATEPYVDTPQFYLTGLYVMWIFTAVAFASYARAHPRVGRLVVALAIAIALPSSIRYLARKWNDPERPPRAAMTRGEVTIAEYLRKTSDPETTVVLHDRPLAPSLTTIVSERRIVLGWDVTYSAVGGEERLRDVNAFYASANGDPDAAFETLRRYRVTHVIVKDPGDQVHPAVLARLKRLLEFPAITLYAVPSLAGP